MCIHLYGDKNEVVEALFKEALSQAEDIEKSGGSRSLENLRYQLAEVACKWDMTTAKMLLGILLRASFKGPNEQHLYVLTSNESSKRRFKQSIEVALDLFSTRENGLLKGMFLLQKVLTVQKRFSLAEMVSRRILMQVEEDWGRVHPLATLALHNISRILRSQQRHTTAEAILEDMIQRETDTFGEDHITILTNRYHLAKSIRRVTKIDMRRQKYCSETFSTEAKEF
jgi:hypothetical protein